MKSLFLRMFLSFCGATAVAVLGAVAGYVFSNPDQVAFAWPRVGRGAILSAGRFAITAYERGGRPELAAYLASLWRDTGIRGALFDSASRPLNFLGFPGGVPAEMAVQSEEHLIFRMRERVAAVRLRGGRGDSYVFVTRLPRREANFFWSRTFIVAFILSGGLLCYLLARHVTSRWRNCARLLRGFPRAISRRASRPPRCWGGRTKSGASRAISTTWPCASRI